MLHPRREFLTALPESRKSVNRHNFVPSFATIVLALVFMKVWDHTLEEDADLPRSASSKSKAQSGGTRSSAQTPSHERDLSCLNVVIGKFL
jgi:hypothetical protein